MNMPPTQAPTTLNDASLENIKMSARQNSPDAMREAAQQFEALFVNMMLKSMRDATPQDGILDNNQSRMFTAMLDQELSQVFAEKGIGLADAMLQQLENNQRAAINGIGNLSSSRQDTTQTVSSINNQTSALAPSTYSAQEVSQAYAAVSDSSQPEHVQKFIEEMTPYAEDASRNSGIPAKFMLAQAALETGWGRHQITNSDGSSAKNLFGIKAGNSWKGDVANSRTTEYENGVAMKKNEPFRAYDSYADSFNDYAKLISSSSRYEGVMKNSQDAIGFAQGLQEAGYATDPHYAEKLSRIIQTAFNS